MSIGGLLVGAFLQQCNGCWVLESHHMFLKKKKWCNLVWKYLGVALKESNSIFISVTRRSRSDVVHSLSHSLTGHTEMGCAPPSNLSKGKIILDFFKATPNRSRTGYTIFSLFKHFGETPCPCLFKLDSYQSQWILMSLNESQRVSMNLNESERVSMSLNESQWVSMSLNESQWVWKNLNESQWVSMSLNESQWVWKNLNESQWVSMNVMKTSASRCHSRSLSVATQSAPCINIA